MENDAGSMGLEYPIECAPSLVSVPLLLLKVCRILEEYLGCLNIIH